LGQVRRQAGRRPDAKRGQRLPAVGGEAAGSPEDDLMMAGREWVYEVLRFWFEEARPTQWFEKDERFDAEVRRRFLALHETLAKQPLASLLTDERTMLASVIVFDQMPRNMFRGTPRAFATDGRALKIADAAVAQGFDRSLTKDARMFLYLPFEHAESTQVQVRSVALMAALGDPALTRWAEAHKAVIDRFGRFPHRNAVLGRPSTPAEIEFLKQPGSSF
jgi:uncharacterized protein (DUF924 family)